MSPEKLLALCLIFAGFVLAALWLRELLLDFAERQFADEFGGDTPDGDWPNIPDDLKFCSFHGRKDYDRA